MLTDRGRNALGFCSSLAIATALAAVPHAVRAQSFQGSSAVVAGSATVTTGTNTTTVNVASPQAVINWTPFDTATSPGTPIDFQPAGTTATFQSTSDFAVLNRILPTDASRPVIFNGTVISQIQSTLTSPGGTVYFYSPGGVIVGSSAVFNVGNLGLTTSDPLVSGGNFISAGSQVAFTGAVPGSRVDIRAGAQINALNAGSYVAAFAPAIVQNGTVTVNGRAAYVAGEAGTITFNPDGLYDIQVTTGTDSAGAIQHNGTTTGSASSGGTDNRRAYLVAVPKNQLITLAIGRGSKLGFDIAGAANVSGNSVVLSAGQNVTNGTIDAAPAGGTGSADIAISDWALNLPSGVDFTSSVIGRASRSARLNVLSNTNFASDVSLSARDDALAIVTIATSSTAGLLTTGHLAVAGNLTLSAERQVAIAGSPVDAGSARMIVFGGATADIMGDVSLQANAYAFSTADGATTGGDASLIVDSDPSLNPITSSLSIGGNLLIRAQGLADSASTATSGTGGNAQITLSGASNATVGGVTRIRSDGVSALGADATGGFSGLSIQAGSGFTTSELNVSADADGGFTGPSATPGLSAGGTAIISVSGANSTLTVQSGNSTGNGNFGDRDLLSADAFAGASNAAGGTGGAAQGGFAQFAVSNGAVANLPVNPGAAGNVRMRAQAYGGDTFATGGTGGTAIGGTVDLVVNGGTLNAGNTLLPTSFAQGGSADVSVTGAANGGNAVGGTRNVTVINGMLNGSFSGGGPGAGGGNGSLLGVGGNGTGGTANFFMDNGTITATTDAFGISRVLAFAQNSGGGGGMGGNASGGTVNVTIQNGSSITANPDANGVGGIVAFTASNSTFDQTADGIISTGDATAGTVNLTIRNSQINAAEFRVAADAATGSILTSTGAGINAHAGNAAGGTANLNLSGATINAGFMSVSAVAEAGEADDPGTVNGGNATGGTALLFASGAPSTITVSDLEVDASATGGTVYSGPGNGGNAIGGRALLQANNGGRLTVTGSTFVDAGADGHSAQVQGRGGDGSSGFAEVSAVGGGSLTLNGDLEVSAIAESGDGNVAGLASAQFQPTPTDFLPNAIVYAQNGSITVSGLTSLSSDSYGGVGFAGGKGGNALAGSAVVNSDNGLAGSSTISLQDLVISASGYGGDGGIGASGAVGGAGGDATGGEVDAFAGAGNGSLTVAGQTSLYAAAIGGTGGEGGSGTTGGTGGVGGTATGGQTIFGTLSRADTGAVNTGAASFADVLAFAEATGGLGGAGGNGTSGNGDGGTGGAAFGGASLLIVRGSQVTVTGQASLAGDAIGGDGGTGAVQGAGGAATAGGDGGVGIAVSSRFQQPAQRGFLNAADIFGSAQAIGGNGSVVGAADVADSPISINIADGDASIGSLSLFASGDPIAGVRPSPISIARGTVNVGSLAMSTPGELSIALDSSTVNVADLSLEAGNFVLPTVRPATFGSFNVTNTFDVTSGLDFLAYANFALAGGGTFDADGSVLTGDITSNALLDIAAVGSITTGAIDAASVALNAGQGVTTAAIVSDGGIFIGAGGPVSVGDLTAGGTTPGAGKIAIGSSAGPVTTGALRSTGDLGVQTAGSITTGNLIGRDVLLLAGGSLSTGSILAASGTQATGAIFFGNFSMASSAANVFQQFRGQTSMLPIFQAAPVAIGGSATFNGAIQGGTMRGAAQGALSAQAITAANFIELAAGGLASVNGAWRSPDIELVSNDIAIAQAGSLDALSINGSIDLYSTNAAGVTVGDLQGGGGYTLDNAEFSRINAGEIQIVGIDSQQATDMTIGNLSIAGSQLYGDGGSVLFATGDRATATPGGILRIAGAVTATGLAPANEIDLLSGTVEIEAASGSLKVSDGSNNLGGVVFIEADRIHVASSEILDKLRADPLYVGHIADLNTPLAVSRPDGVLNALGLELHPGQTLYVQNTGTVVKPAGFLTRLDSTDVFAPDVLPVGGIEVVINGQFQTDTGTVSGRAASDLVQAGAASDPQAFAGFSTTSQINGCLFAGGACSAILVTDPVAAISSEITIVTAATLDDSPVAPAAEDADEGGDRLSDDKDEDDDSDPGASPIAPPTPLINTGQLNPNLTVEEPVAGAGNPALLGSAVNEDIPQGDPK